jgi:DNA-directed RNA polymerase specialized sigma24 family protein
MDELKFSQNQLIERVNNLYYGIVRKTINKHNSETEKRREIIHEPMNVLSNITEKIMDKQLPRTTSAFVRACEIGEESIRYLTYSAALSLIADYRKEKRDALSQAYLVSDSHDQELSSDWKLGVTDSDETEKWTRAIELSNSLSNPIDRKILKLLSHGHTEKEIADLFRKSGEKVSIRTISRRKKLIKEKISKRNTKETDRKGVTKPFTTS